MKLKKKNKQNYNMTYNSYNNKFIIYSNIVIL